MKFGKPILRLHPPILFRRNTVAVGNESNATDSIYKNYDRGNLPVLIDLSGLVRDNSYKRAALWTGENIQLTVMEIPVGGEIGLENHKDTEQLIGIESGTAEVLMGKEPENLKSYGIATRGYATIVPKDTWHNVKNVGRTPLKLYSVYSPPHHPYGTLEKASSGQED